MVVRVIVVVLAASAVLIAGCGGASKPAASPTGTATTATAAVTAVPTASAAADEAPMPQHVTFAPGETISADGQAGIFFLDPKTGEAEGWVVPAATFPDSGPLPFSFTVGGFSADGGEVVYTCLEPKANSGPVPCGGGAHELWYLLDTGSGERTRLDAFTGPFLTISPDGSTLFGQTADAFALADVSQAGVQRPAALPADSDTSYPHVDWSADGGRLVLTTGGAKSTFLVDTTSGRVTPLNIASYSGSWSPDGARLVMWKQIEEGQGEFRMLDRDGRLVWSKRASSNGTSGAWSADGSLLYAEVQDRPAASPGFGPLDRVDVMDGTTGVTRYRIRSGFCPIGWVGETHRLLTESYGFREALVDLAAGTLKFIDGYGIPTPFDPNLAILFDGSDFRSYDLTTGATKLIAHTTIGPAWDTNHGALFAGNRLVFTPLHGGHGGCGEGAGPENPPRPEGVVGPFADDAPVTRGPGQ